MSVRFSAIISTYKRPDDFARALDSILKQTALPVEVLVVNDDPEEQLTGIVSTSPSVSVVVINNTTNGGKTFSLRAAAERATGDYLAFLDDDDEWLPQHLECFARTISEQKFPQNYLYFCPVQILRDSGTSIRPKTGKKSGRSFLEYIILDGGLIQNSSIVIRRDRFLDFDFDLSNRKHVDYDICMWAEIRNMGFIMSRSPTAIWNCRSRPSAGLRLSKSLPSHSQRWISYWASKSKGIGARLRHGFIAFHMAPLLAKQAPLRSLQLLAAAAFRGYISPRLYWRCLMNYARASHCRSERRHSL